MSLSAADYSAIVVSLKLAFTVTVLLILIGTPLAWWLARTKVWWRGIIEAVVALPLVLPPTVIGFYLLLAFAANGPLGQLSHALGLASLAFTFWGLVIGSCIYSLPFVVQPIHNAMRAIGPAPLEAAATLGAGPWDRFFSIVLPLAKPGFVTAATLGFAHTLGEFGVVLMIGGNIPGETQVVATQIYEHVEALDYQQAHLLSALTIIFSFVVLFIVYFFQGKKSQPIM